jgi:hypothetical protein
MTTAEQGPGANDLGELVIKTRATNWQPNFSLSGAGQPGTYIYQLVLDHGASEVMLTLSEGDADNLFDGLSSAAGSTTTPSER